MRRMILGAGISPFLSRPAAGTAPPETVPIGALYGTGPGEVPMDHKYAEGTASGGNITAVPNSGGAGAVFNLTAFGTIPISGQAVDLDPSDYFTLASRADLSGTRLFIVADIRAFTSNQYFAGQNGSAGEGGNTNVFLLSGGATLRIAKNTGTNINADIPLSPAVSAGLRLYEIELTTGGNATVWVNGEQRGMIANPHNGYNILRIAAGQSTGSAGLNALLYRSLSLIQGGDYEANVASIRAELDTEYNLGLSPVAPTLTGGSLTIA